MTKPSTHEDCKDCGVSLITKKERESGLCHYCATRKVPGAIYMEEYPSEEAEGVAE